MQQFHYNNCDLRINNYNSSHPSTSDYKGYAMQQATAQNEAVLSSLLDQSLDGYWICDASPGYLICHVSDGFCAFTGYSREEILGQPCSFLQGEDTDSAKVVELQTKLAAGLPFKGKLLNYRKDGSSFWNYLRIDPVRNDAGEVEQFIGVQTDIALLVDEGALHYAELAHRQREVLSNLSTDRPVGVWETSVDGGAIYCDPSIEKITGLSADKLEADGWLDALHPDDYERMMTTWLAYVESDFTQSYCQECRFVDAVGNIIWVRDHGYPKRNTQGEVVGFYGCIIDITLEKQREIELANQAELARRQREVLDNLSADRPVGIWETNLEGRNIYCDASIEKITGLSFEELLVDGWTKSIHPEDVERFFSGWLAYTQSQFEVSFFDTCRFQNKTGQVIWVRAHGYPKRNEQGEVIGFYGCIIDITLEKQRELDHASKAADLEMIYATMDVGMLATDAQGRCFNANDNLCRMTGLPAVVLQQGEWQQNVHPEDVDGVIRDWQEYRQQKQRQTLSREFRFQHEDGQVVWVRMSSKQLQTKEDMGGLLTTFIDITEQKQLELELIAANQQQEEIATDVAAVLTQVAAGNFSQSYHAKHKYHPIIMSCTSLLKTLQIFSSEIVRLSQDIGVKGILGGQAAVFGAEGTWSEIVKNVNLMANNLTTQVRNVTSYAEALADGVLDYQENINIDSPGEVQTLMRAMRQLHDNLTSIRQRAEQLMAGDLSSEIAVKGEYDALGATLNEMTHSLSESLAKLSEERNFLATIFNTIRDAMVCIDDKACIVKINQCLCDMFGYDESELLGSNIKILMGVGDAKQHDQKITTYKETKEPQIIGVGRKVTGKKKDGALFPMRLCVGEVKKAGGSMYVGIISDLTEEELTTKQLESRKA